MPRKEGHLLADGYKCKKKTLDIPLSMFKLLITLLMVYKYTLSSSKITGLLPNSVAGEEGNRSKLLK